MTPQSTPQSPARITSTATEAVSCRCSTFAELFAIDRRYRGRKQQAKATCPPQTRTWCHRPSCHRSSTERKKRKRCSHRMTFPANASIRGEAARCISRISTKWIWLLSHNSAKSTDYSGFQKEKSSNLPRICRAYRRRGRRKVRIRMYFLYQINSSLSAKIAHKQIAVKAKWIRCRINSKREIKISRCRSVVPMAPLSSQNSASPASSATTRDSKKSKKTPSKYRDRSLYRDRSNWKTILK